MSTDQTNKHKQEEHMFKKLHLFYKDGFSKMTVGKSLWIIALLKLFIMFAILRVFFFPNFLNSNFDTDKEKSNHVRQELIDKTK